MKDVPLFVEEAGSGDAVVLVHGFSLDTRMWDSQFHVLAQQYRVIRYDMRGFGRSSPPDGLYAQAEDLAALLDALAVERAHVVGFSMGGGVALDFAILYPARVKRLVLMDAAIGGHAWSDAWDTSMKTIWARGRRGDVAQARQLWLDHPLFAHALVNPASAEHLRTIITEYSGWHWRYRDPLNTMDPPAMSRLDTVRAPTLVLLGEEDLPDFHAIAAKLAVGIPDAHLALVPGAGHMTNMECASIVNQELLAFLGGSDAGTPRA